MNLRATSCCRILAALASCAALASGCGGGAGTAPGLAPVAPRGISGIAYGNGNPLRGAALSLYAAGAEGYGSGASILASAVSGTDGAWQLQFSCPADNPQVYLTAAGGDAGAGANGAGVMLAALGPCSSMPASVVVNELTTAAAVFALSQFLDFSGGIGTPAGNSLGLNNAARVVADFADAATGQAAAALSAGTNSPVTLNTLADLAAGCVGALQGSAQCQDLFAAAAAAGDPAIDNTLQALLAIARHPAWNAAVLYQAWSGTGPFQPTLSAAPDDWALRFDMTGGGLNQPKAVAIDAAGNAWVAGYGAAVAVFAPDGTALSGAGGYSGGGLEQSYGIAIDGAGDVWVTNEESPAGVNQELGSVVELSANGAGLSGASGYSGGGVDFPQAVAVDAGGRAWIADFGSSALTLLDANGAAVSPSSGWAGGGLDFPVAVAIDAANVVWAADQGNNSVAAFGPSGVPLSPPGGYTGGGLDVPAGLCLDLAGNVWVTDFDGDSMAEFAGSAAASPGSAISPVSGYVGAGLVSPDACAADGAGNIWVSSYNGASISELQGGSGASAGMPLSGAVGYAKGALDAPQGIAVDASGNVWVVNAGDDRLSLFPGLAAPVRTPMLGPPASP